MRYYNNVPYCIVKKQIQFIILWFEPLRGHIEKQKSANY